MTEISDVLFKYVLLFVIAAIVLGIGVLIYLSMINGWEQEKKCAEKGGIMLAGTMNGCVLIRPAE